MQFEVAACAESNSTMWSRETTKSPVLQILRKKSMSMILNFSYILGKGNHSYIRSDSFN